MLPSGLKENVKQCTGRGTTSNNFGRAVDQIGRNLGESNNKS
jgi:hypothetical protein